MLNCYYLGYNEQIVFQSIAQEKNEPGRSTLNGVTGRVLTRYSQYLTNFQNISLGKPEFSNAEIVEKDALQICYSSPTASFKIIRGKIFSSQPDQLKTLCPYCLLDRPRTLDHYVGQTEFPEFSILLKNLIPCCHDCNNKKGENWRSYKRRRFLHFYNDTFLNHRFLFGRLILPKSGSAPRIVFYLKNNSALSSDQFSLVRTHFRDLNLLTEYAHRSNSLFSSEIEIIRDGRAASQSIPEILAALKRRYDSCVRRGGVNFWEAVLYEVLLNDKRVFTI